MEETGAEADVSNIVAATMKARYGSRVIDVGQDTYLSKRELNSKFHLTVLLPTNATAANHSAVDG